MTKPKETVKNISEEEIGSFWAFLDSICDTSLLNDEPDKWLKSHDKRLSSHLKSEWLKEAKKRLKKRKQDWLKANEDKFYGKSFIEIQADIYINLLFEDVLEIISKMEK